MKQFIDLPQKNKSFCCDGLWFGGIYCRVADHAWCLINPLFIFESNFSPYRIEIKRPEGI